MTNKSPAFQFYPGDFLSDENVISMNCEERGVYITLLCNCWIQGSIPADHTKILRLLQGYPGPLPEIVMDRFKPLPEKPDRLVNNRLEKERKKQSDFREKKSNSGKKGGASRWKDHKKKDENSNGTAIVSPMAKNGSLFSSSSSSSSSPLKPSEISEKSQTKNQDLQPLWDKCLIMVKSQVSAESHRLFDDTFPSYKQGGILFIGVPNQIIRKAMIEQYREMIELFLEQITGKRLMVDFRIERNQ